MNQQIFGFGDVMTLTGVARSKLTHWVQSGAVAAGIREASGTGHHRVFSFANLVAVAIAAALARNGVTLAGIQRVLAALPAPLPVGPDDLLLFVMGDPAHAGSQWAGARAEFVAELRHTFLIHEPVGILIDVGRIIQTLTAQIGDGR